MKYGFIAVIVGSLWTTVAVRADQLQPLTHSDIAEYAALAPDEDAAILLREAGNAYFSYLSQLASLRQSVREWAAAPYELMPGHAAEDDRYMRAGQRFEELASDETTARTAALLSRVEELLPDLPAWRSPQWEHYRQSLFATAPIRGNRCPDLIAVLQEILPPDKWSPGLAATANAYARDCRPILDLLLARLSSTEFTRLYRTYAANGDEAALADLIFEYQKPDALLREVTLQYASRIGSFLSRDASYRFTWRVNAFSYPHLSRAHDLSNTLDRINDGHVERNEARSQSILEAKATLASLLAEDWPKLKQLIDEAASVQGCRTAADAEAAAACSSPATSSSSILEKRKRDFQNELDKAERKLKSLPRKRRQSGRPEGDSTLTLRKGIVGIDPRSPRWIEQSALQEVLESLDASESQVSVAMELYRQAEVRLGRHEEEFEEGLIRALKERNAAANNVGADNSRLDRLRIHKLWTRWYDDERHVAEEFERAVSRILTDSQQPEWETAVRRGVRLSLLREARQYGLRRHYDVSALLSSACEGHDDHDALARYLEGYSVQLSSDAKSYMRALSEQVIHLRFVIERLNIQGVRGLEGIIPEEQFQLVQSAAWEVAYPSVFVESPVVTFLNSLKGPDSDAIGGVNDALDQYIEQDKALRAAICRAWDIFDSESVALARLDGEQPRYPAVGVWQSRASLLRMAIDEISQSLKEKPESRVPVCFVLLEEWSDGLP